MIKTFIIVIIIIRIIIVSIIKFIIIAVIIFGDKCYDENCKSICYR